MDLFDYSPDSHKIKKIYIHAASRGRRVMNSCVPIIDDKKGTQNYYAENY